MSRAKSTASSQKVKQLTKVYFKRETSFTISLYISSNEVLQSNPKAERASNYFCNFNCDTNLNVPCPKTVPCLISSLREIPPICLTENWLDFSCANMLAAYNIKKVRKFSMTNTLHLDQEINS